MQTGKNENHTKMMKKKITQQKNRWMKRSTRCDTKNHWTNMKKQEKIEIKKNLISLAKILYFYFLVFTLKSYRTFNSMQKHPKTSSA